MKILTVSIISLASIIGSALGNDNKTDQTHFSIIWKDNKGTHELTYPLPDLVKELFKIVTKQEERMTLLEEKITLLEERIVVQEERLEEQDAFIITTHEEYWDRERVFFSNFKLETEITLNRHEKQIKAIKNNIISNL